MSFIRRKVEVLNHWIAFADQFQTSSLAFYDRLEEEIEERRIPGLVKERVDFAEGGALSEKRVYLRMVRERIVFDICAAPFGEGFFFSCRTANIPSVIKLWQLALMFAAFLMILSLTVRLVGLFWGPLLLIPGLMFVIYAARNAIALNLHDLDRVFLHSPVFGPLYERFIRKETYYRYDTRLMYLDAIPQIVKRIAEDETSAKGIKLERQYELPVILGELYKPVKPRLTSLPD